MKPFARIFLLLVAVAIVASLVPAAASACPLCKDAKSDTDYAGGTASLPNGFYYSILLMVCAPFAVVGALAARIALARRRLRLASPAPDSEGASPPLSTESAGSRP
ncbi:MAG: hypothetical protein M3R62_08385 [Acidobacteriota bacterium]|nr:hypothetical protein [Acidobacteriota bacterium]